MWLPVSVGRRFGYLVVGSAVALAPALVVPPSSGVERVLAACDNVVDTTDSFSMNCVPTVIPDTSDQLTEAEVAAPGFNASPGGSADRGAGGGGHH